MRQAEVPTWQPLAESVAVVVVLAAGCVALFLALPGDGSLDLVTLNRAGAVGVGNAWTEPWRLLSNTWLHADPGHLIGNMVMLLLMSVLLTRALGFDRFLLLYLAGGLAGSIASVLLEQPRSLVGASGAVFTLTGATVAYAVRPRGVLHEVEVHAVREALFPIVAGQILMSFAPGISWAGHLGGFALGALAAGTGLLDLGLPERSTGVRMAPVRWAWVATSTVAVLGIGCCSNGWGVFALLGLYAFVVVLGGRGAPDWRPEMHPVVLLAAVGALLVNGAAVGIALRAGQPWDLTVAPRGQTVPMTTVALPGGLGEVALPSPLVEAREEREAGVVRFGDPETFPFAIQVVAGVVESPAQTVREQLELELDGEVRTFHFGRWDAACPWLGWETRRAAGMIVFTAEGVAEVQLLRLESPSDLQWARAEDAAVHALSTLDGCAPSPWTPGEIGRAFEAAGLRDLAILAIERQLRETPDDLELRLVEAELYLSAGRCDPALIEFGHVNRRDPKNAHAWAGIARSTLACGSAREHVESAEEAAARAVALDEDLGMAWEASGDALIAQGRRDEASAAYSEAARLAEDPTERARLQDRAAKAKSGFRVRDRIGD